MVLPNGDIMRLKIGARQGTYPAWWKEIRVEIYGWSPSKNQILVNGHAVKARIERSARKIGFTLADDGTLSEVEVR